MAWPVGTICEVRGERLSLAFAGMLVALVLGCGGGSSGGGGGGAPVIAKMDLSGATALVLGSRPAAGRALSAAQDSQVLYKLTDTGLLVEVVLLDDGGNPIASTVYQPRHIEDVDDNFVLVEFFRFDSTPPFFLIRKSDGAVFPMAHEPRSLADGLDRRRYLFGVANEAAADDGYAYYFEGGGPGPLRRLSLPSTGSPVDSQISPQSDQPFRGTGHHNNGFAVSGEGTIVYRNEDTYRVITQAGRVLDLTQELLSGQPELAPYILGTIPGFVGGYGDFFVGADGDIYINDKDFLNFRWRELYWLPQDSDGLYPSDPPAPDSGSILVYDESGSAVEAYDPTTGELVDFRQPISVCGGGASGDCESYEFVVPDDWSWFPTPYGQTFPQGSFLDGNGAFLPAVYDANGDRYGWFWYDNELFAPIWRLSETESGGVRIDPYGAGIATAHRWLPEQAPAGLLRYDASTEETRVWWSTGADHLYLTAGDRIIVAGINSGRVFEVNSPSGIPSLVESASTVVTNVRDAESTASHYYLLGRAADDNQISLYRIDTATHTPTELIDGAEYEVYGFTVTSTDEVVFRAARRSDGADLGGTIGLTGEIEIIEAIQNLSEIELVRVL